MPHPEATPHIRLDLYQVRSSAVAATITGTPTRTIHALLAVHGFEPLDDQTMVMARIDREEPHYAERAARALRAENIPVDITAELREEIDTEWTWANYPMPWCSREEIREVSGDAQKIYDDIRHGRLIVHAHAHDGWTTVAVGTYLDGPSIHLHGENHLRTESSRYDNPVEAIAEFERLYGDAVRPGPAPATDTEREAEQARTPPSPDAQAGAEPSLATTESPTTEADDHEALLNDFLASHGEWEKWRTWPDDTTHAVHESLVLRAEFVHEAEAGDVQWKIAAYESPVGERLWHATATTNVPVEMMRVLLDSLASGDAAEIAAGNQISQVTIEAATRPIADAGWEQTLDGRWIRWQAPGNHPVGVAFDAFAAHAHHSALPAWTIWAGSDPANPRWALRLSPHAAASVLRDVAFELGDQYAVAPAGAQRQSGLHSASPIPYPTAGIPAKTR
ncbi:uncharacterized protein DUF317 [Streptomyces sp. 840.1]|uniref:DUF317 domain-containing protein n=1 Tax=Streptomyces sp. 840.1 TaxID=2485152 RepID=UPI000F471A76|nr:DUF317 domain-containing protein [Streptomyces sp. 840.1]ROQ70140.1 uncharacterized protein DUF317 [Streptomyces sp. 840.1]